MIVEKEQANRKQMLANINSVIDEKVFGLSLALAKEKKAREEDENAFYGEVQEELHGLQEEIEIEKSITEENTGRLKVISR